MSRATPGWSLADIRIVRYALGATVAMAIALGSPWETSYLTPVLVATFLAYPDKPLTPRLGAALIVIVGVAIWFGWQVGHLIAYPALFLLFGFAGAVLDLLCAGSAGGRRSYSCGS